MLFASWFSLRVRSTYVNWFWKDSACFLRLLYPPLFADKNVTYLIGQKLKVSLKKSSEIKMSLKITQIWNILFGRNLLYALENVTHPWAHTLFWPGSMGKGEGMSNWWRTYLRAWVHWSNPLQQYCRGTVDLSNVLFGTAELPMLWCSRALLSKLWPSQQGVLHKGSLAGFTDVLSLTLLLANWPFRLKEVLPAKMLKILAEIGL